MPIISLTFNAAWLLLVLTGRGAAAGDSWMPRKVQVQVGGLRSSGLRVWGWLRASRINLIGVEYL